MRILVLGCGWVGEEVALYYLSQGDEVWATVTTEEKRGTLEQMGIHTSVVDFDKDDAIDLFDVEFDYVLNSIPATSRHTEGVLTNRFDNVLSFMMRLPYAKHIFLSSVGIYPDVDGLFNEEFKVFRQNRLRQAEEKMERLPATTIYRLGGLFGKNRVFAKYFAGKVCTTGEQPANFVHIDDVVDLVTHGFDKLQTGEVYNIVCPDHPLKKDVIIHSAQKHSYDLPSAFVPELDFHKIVSSQKIIEALDYRFKYPSPMDF